MMMVFLFSFFLVRLLMFVFVMEGEVMKCLLIVSVGMLLMW